MNESDKEHLLKIEKLLQYLLAIEMWRAGLSQSDIKKRLGISSNTVNGMLKGIKREHTIQSSE